MGSGRTLSASSIHQKANGRSEKTVGAGMNQDREQKAVLRGQKEVAMDSVNYVTASTPRNVQKCHAYGNRNNRF